MCRHHETKSFLPTNFHTHYSFSDSGLVVMDQSVQTIICQFIIYNCMYLRICHCCYTNRRRKCACESREMHLSYISCPIDLKVRIISNYCHVSLSLKFTYYYTCMGHKGGAVCFCFACNRHVDDLFEFTNALTHCSHQPTEHGSFCVDSNYVCIINTRNDISQC